MYHVTCTDAETDSVGQKVYLRQMLYDNSVALGMGSLWVNSDRPSIYIPRERSDRTNKTTPYKNIPI